MTLTSLFMSSIRKLSENFTRTNWRFQNIWLPFVWVQLDQVIQNKSRRRRLKKILRNSEKQLIKWFACFEAENAVEIFRKCGKVDINLHLLNFNDICDITNWTHVDWLCKWFFQGLFTPSKCFYSFIIGHLIFFEIMAYLVLYYYGTGWLPTCLSILFYTIVQVSLLAGRMLVLC